MSRHSILTVLLVDLLLCALLPLFQPTVPTMFVTGLLMMICVLVGMQLTHVLDFYEEAHEEVRDEWALTLEVPK